jgi:hypothetical protein
MLRILLDTLTLALSPLAARAASDIQDPQAWTMRYILVNGTDDATLIAATTDIASHSRLRTPDMHELLAELLAEIAAGKITAPETAVDIVRILSAAPDAQRYHTVIRSARRLSEKGMQQAQTAYTKRFLRAKGEQWTAGGVDLDALRRGYADAAFAQQPTLERFQAFANLPKAVSLPELFAAVGAPSHVRPRDTRAVQSYGGIDVRQIVVYYRGIGSATFNYADASGWHLFSKDLEPLAYEELMPYRRDPAAYGLPDATALAISQLLSGQLAAMRTSAMAMYRLDAAPVDYLDVAAEMLSRNYATVRSDALADSYAWLCNLLERHGGTRYHTLLVDVAKGAKHPKLRRHASTSIRKQPASLPRFVPGSVALDELARRYPSPYPAFAGAAESAP